MSTYSILIDCCSQSPANLMNCLGSIYDTVGTPEDIVLLFNPYNTIYNQTFDLLDTRFCSIIKLSSPAKFKSVGELLRETIQSDRLIFLRDNFVVRHENLFLVLNSLHNEEKVCVFLDTTMQCFSIDVNVWKNYLQGGLVNIKGLIENSSIYKTLLDTSLIRQR